MKVFELDVKKSRKIKVFEVQYKNLLPPFFVFHFIVMVPVCQKNIFCFPKKSLDKVLNIK